MGSCLGRCVALGYVIPFSSLGRREGDGRGKFAVLAPSIFKTPKGFFFLCRDPNEVPDIDYTSPSLSNQQLDDHVFDTMPPRIKSGVISG